MKKSLLAITMGDPAGIGPETIVGAWENLALHRTAQLVVVGHPEVLRRAARLRSCTSQIMEVSSPEEAHSSESVIPCLSCGSDAAAKVAPSTIDARGGQAAFDAVVLATELALGGRVDGIITAPLNKAAFAAAGHQYPGHTELLADLCGVGEAAMMLYLAPGGAVRGSAGLGVVHVTLHTALRKVFDLLTPERIVAKAHLAESVMQELLNSPPPPASFQTENGQTENGRADEIQSYRPRIGVCALNPHAGEQTLFGDEEETIIRPAVERGRGEGLLLSGPFSTDVLMVRAAAGEFDALVAMFHDQGHIALKLLGMHRAVNITLGLPIVRTSVAHGTAFDLAWRGKAEVSGMLHAISTAARLVHARKSKPQKHAEKT